MDLQELEEDLQEVEVVLSGVLSLFIHMSLILILIAFVIPQLLIFFYINYLFDLCF